MAKTTSPTSETSEPTSLSFHPSPVIAMLFLVAFLCVLAGIGYFFWNSDLFSIAWRSVTLLGLACFAYLYASRVTSVYTVTPLEVAMDIGILSKRRKSAPLNRITNFEIVRPFYKRLFGLADLMVDTAGTSAVEIQMTEMRRAEAEAISRLLSKYLGQQKVEEAGSDKELRSVRKAALQSAAEADSSP